MIESSHFIYPIKRTVPSPTIHAAFRGLSLVVSATYDIVKMINLGIITQEDLANFSDDMNESVQELLERHYRQW